jgi:hypothetical protein
LADAAFGLELAGVGLEAEVAGAERDRRILGRARHQRARDPARTVDPAVEAVAQAVHAGLVVVRREAGQERLHLVGLAVAVGVAGEEDVGRCADEHAVAPDRHARGERERLEEDRARVVGAVAVSILEGDDASAGREVAGDAVRVVVHLRDPQAAVAAEVDRHGARDQGLARDELDLEAGAHAEGRELLCRRLRRDSFDARERHTEHLLERRGDLAQDLVDDAPLDAGGEACRLVVVDHRALGLVAAFGEDALGRDVAGDVVRVGADPDARAIQLALQAQGVVDDDLSAEEDQGELLAEAPRLHGVAQLGRERLAALEAREVLAGVVAEGAGVARGALGPLLPCRMSVERERDLREVRIKRAREDALVPEQSLDLQRQGDPVRPRVLDAGARLWIGVRAAADRDERDRPRMARLELGRGEARPVAADEIRLGPERRAVAGVVGDQGEDRAALVAGDEERQLVIDGTSCRAPVRGESDLASGDRERPRREGSDGFARRLNDTRLEHIAGVGHDALLLLDGEFGAEHVWDRTVDLRAVVGVGDREDEALARDAALRAQPGRDARRQRAGNGHQIEGHQHGRRLAVAGDRERSGEERLQHSLRLGAARRIAAEPDRLRGSDLDPCRAEAEGSHLEATLRARPIVRGLAAGEGREDGGGEREPRARTHGRFHSLAAGASHQRRGPHSALRRVAPRIARGRAGRPPGSRRPCRA